MCVCGMKNLLEKEKYLNVVNKQTNKKFFIAMKKQMDPVKSNGKEKIFFFPSSSLNYAKTLPKQKMFSPLFFND